MKNTTTPTFSRRDRLDNKHSLVWGRYPDESLSDIEVCFKIIAKDQEMTQHFAELYRAFIVGDNSANPIDLISDRYTV